jgi:hypothetical protein
MQLERESFEAGIQERKLMKAKFTPPPTVQVSWETVKFAKTAESKTTEGDMASVKSEMAEVAVWDANPTKVDATTAVQPQMTEVTAIVAVAAETTDGGVATGTIDTTLNGVAREMETQSSSTDAQGEPDPWRGPVHMGVACNGCENNPISGIRWKCLTCNDYDLCDACHASGAHPSEHQMLKIEDPADAENLHDEVRDASDAKETCRLLIYFGM